MSKDNQLKLESEWGTPNNMPTNDVEFFQEVVAYKMSTVPVVLHKKWIFNLMAIEKRKRNRTFRRRRRKGNIR